MSDDEADPLFYDPKPGENASIKLKVDELKTQRANAKGRITRMKNYIALKQDSLSHSELECRLGILESYWKLVNQLQAQIEKLNPNDTAHDTIRDDLEDLYCEVKSRIISLIPNLNRSSTFETSETAPVVITTSPKPNLPKLKLPTFAGRYSDYPHFIATFNTLVGNDNKISIVEKYSYLRSCLVGPALSTIDALGNSADNYQNALSALKERYDNKCLIFQEQVAELFEVPKVSKGSAVQLRSLVDKVSAHLSSLKTIGGEIDIMHAMIIHLVNSKLDTDTQAKWDESIDYAELPTWEKMPKVLSRRCQFLEAREGKGQRSQPNDNFSSNFHRSNQRVRTAQHVNQSSTAYTVSHSHCIFCSETSHTIEKCNMFNDLSVLDRFAQVKRLSLCLKCLKPGHSVKNCNISNCRVCLGRHHVLLHRYSNGSDNVNRETANTSANISTNSSINSNDSVTAVIPAPSPSSSNISYHASNDSHFDHVFLATAIIKIKDSQGSYKFAHALLDSASQINFISERLVHLLRLRRIPVDGSVDGIGELSTKIRHQTTAVIKSRCNEFETSLEMWVLPTITNSHPNKEINITHWNIPKNIELADPHFEKPQKIDLLIGADIFFDLLCVGQIKLGENLPLLQKTLFGWILSGRCKQMSVGHQMCNVVTESNSLDENEQLTKLVESFWKIEDIDAKHTKLTIEQQTCENVFQESVHQSTDGRLMVKLPFKKSPSELGDSFEIAKRRFFSLERRLAKNCELKQQYSSFLQEYLSMGHMELVSMTEIPRNNYFMPHQCVLRPDSSSTKLRVVFDASCRTSSNVSLNDILAVGPVVQNDLYSIIFKFRCFPYALTADVSKMYRQIWINPDDRHFQYLLWRESNKEELQIYRLKTVTYGTASAPYLATKSLNYLADKFATEFPEAAQVIRESFYVDDLISGSDSQKGLVKIQKEVTLILKSAQMQLCKWYSNDVSFLKNIPEDEQEKPLRINDSDIVKTLGIVWEPKCDKFRFNYQVENPVSTKTSKRSVLSDIARLFDPLGLINPVVVTAKMFMQELWLLKLDWDESLPIECHQRWKKFKESLAELNDVRIPRFVMSLNEPCRTEIHGFCDASVRAYGCCIYIPNVDVYNNISVHLLSSKSKVAPSKKTRTLPILELFGADLLSKLWAKIKNINSKNVDAIYFWTDSYIVLGWLASHASKWQTLVANRVSTIQDLTEDGVWRHVSGKDNPADIISRGSTIGELQNSMWFSGPSFLHQSSDSWPEQRVQTLADLPEQRKNSRTNPKSSLLVNQTDTMLTNIYKISSFVKNRRIYAYVCRFINNVKAKHKNTSLQYGILTSSELENALLKIVYMIQQHHFCDEIAHLKNNKQTQLWMTISN